MFRILAEKARLSFKQFVRQAWHVLEPGARFIPGIQVDAICLHLQAVTEGQIQNLIINLPPGYAKSLLTAVFWPAWVWINHPEVRFLFSSYREDLAVRDSVKCRRLIESDWYQQRWGDRYQMVEDQNQKHRFENDRTGYRVVVPMSGGTGERGDIVVVDDPHSVEQAESDAARIGAIDWWNGTMSTRLNDPNTGHKIVVQQRLHEADLTGDLLARGGYEHLCLPAEFEPDRRCRTSIWTDPRTSPGELLWPRKGEKAKLDDLRLRWGATATRVSSSSDRRPEAGASSRSIGGAIGPIRRCRSAGSGPFTRRHHAEDPRGEPAGRFWITDPELGHGLQGPEHLGLRGGRGMGRQRADRYLLDQVRERLGLSRDGGGRQSPDEEVAQGESKLVEDKANGPAVIQSLRHEIPGLVAVVPDGGKVARAQAVSPQVESGNVYLPHPAIAPWVEAFVEECATFPNGRHDDQVDQISQALNRLRTMVTPPKYFPPMPRPPSGDRGWMA